MLSLVIALVVSWNLKLVPVLCRCVDLRCNRFRWRCVAKRSGCRYLLRWVCLDRLTLKLRRLVLIGWKGVLIGLFFVIGFFR